MIVLPLRHVHYQFHLDGPIQINVQTALKLFVRNALSIIDKIANNVTKTQHYQEEFVHAILATIQLIWQYQLQHKDYGMVSHNLFINVSGTVRFLFHIANLTNAQIQLIVRNANLIIFSLQYLLLNRNVLVALK